MKIRANHVFNLRNGIALLATLAGTAQAHEGHGLDAASHWHASDTLGFVLVGLVCVAVAWYAGRK